LRGFGDYRVGDYRVSDYRVSDYRVSDYRLLCEFHDHDLVVLIVQIGHRSAI